MASKQRSIKIKQLVLASRQDIFAAFTHASALCEWLCNVAEADPRQGGRLYLWWNSAYYSSGEYLSLLPGERIEFSWHGRNEPGITRVKVNLKPAQEGSTLVILTHRGIGSGKEWRQAASEIRRGWKRGLKNLQSVLEDGIDLRFANRPMIGFSGGEEIDAEKAEGLGLAVSKGMLITGVVDGMGAQVAGLQKGDVLFRLDGKEISNYASLVNALQAHSAGDVVKAIAYRNEEKIKFNIQLSARPLPAVPATADVLADSVQKSLDETNTRLKECLHELENAVAAKPIAEGEWSINENLAHLIAVERDAQTWITSMIEGQEITNIYHTNLTTRLTAMLTAYPDVQNLLEELLRSQTETIALLRILPPELVSRKGSFWRLGYNVLENVDHTREHIDHIFASVVEVKPT